MNQGLTLSNLLNQTFAELRDNGRMLGVFLAVTVPINAFNGWIQAGEGNNLFSLNFGFKVTESMMAMGAGIVIGYVAAFVISIVLTYWFYAALVLRDPSPGFGRFWPWLGIYLLAGIGIAGGFILLIIPGIILIVRWSAVLPLVIEGRGPAMDAFGESWTRTGGHSWSIFGAIVVILIGAFIASTVIGAATAIFSGVSSIPMTIATALANAATSAILIALAVAIYRISSDATGDLTEVFE